MIGVALAGGVGALTVFLIAVTSAHRERIARGMLWLSFFGPWMFGADENTTGSATISMVDALRAGLPFACVMTAVMISRPRWSARQTPEVMLAAFLGVALLSSTWSSNSQATVLKGLLFVLQWVALYAVVRRYDTFDDLLRALASVIHILLLSVLVGAVAAPGNAFVGQPARLHGVFPLITSNMLGILAVSGILALVSGVHPSWLLDRHSVQLVLATVYLAELIGARTRAALVVGACICIYAALARARQHPFFAVGLTWLAAGLAVAVASNSSSLLGFLSRGQSAAQLKNLTGRMTIWDAAIDLWRERRVLGHGYYSGHRFDMIPLIHKGASQSNLDNMWIETLVDVGLLGLLPLSLFVVLALRRLQVKLQTGSPSRTFALALAGLLLAASCFNPSLQTNSLPAVLFGVLLLGAAAPTGGRHAAETGIAQIMALQSPRTGREAAIR
jgi:O-antigen ligase